ncbi:MAG TPA: class I SAM-dependent methyltransferase [Myxococcota bacterium]|nr:class I SAM-dependent methyltransferase [Myxococcota bacterium]
MRAVDLDRDMTHVIPTGTTRDSEFLFRRMEALTLAATGLRPGGRVLDSAAGLGQDSRALARTGASAVCAEPSHRMLELAKLVAAKEPPTAPGRVAWARAWSESLPFRSGAFDAAFCKGALDHFDDPERCIAELARVTRADGRVVLAVANFESLGCRLQRSAERLRRRAAKPGRRTYHVPSDHFTRYDSALLRSQVGRFVKIESISGTSLFWGVRRWARLLARLPESWANLLLRAADAVAARFPGLADVIVIAGRPRRPDSV